MDILEDIKSALENGLTQAELARRSGVPQSTISRIPTRKRSPRYDTLQKLHAGVQAFRSEQAEGAQP